MHTVVASRALDYNLSCISAEQSPAQRFFFHSCSRVIHAFLMVIALRSRTGSGFSLRIERIATDRRFLRISRREDRGFERRQHEPALNPGALNEGPTQAGINERTIGRPTDRPIDRLIFSSRRLVAPLLPIAGGNGSL